jgi:hypothetical protein
MDVWKLKREGGITLTEGQCDVGGIVFAEGRGGHAPFFIYTLAIALQLRKSTENLRVAG